MLTPINSSQPMYEKIYYDIIDKIESGVYLENTKIPSEREITETYEVSRITASKALNELSLNNYIYRIQGKGSFVSADGKRPRRQSLRPSNSENSVKKIALIIPQHYDYHSGNIILAAAHTLPYPEYMLNIVLTKMSPDTSVEEFALELFYENSYSGIILFPNDYEFYNDAILQMHLKKFPFVLIDRTFPGINCNYVICDNVKGTQIAVDYLISQGHKRIAFIADIPLDEQVTSIRYNSYMKALTGYDLPVFSYENFAHPMLAGECQQKFINDVKNGTVQAAIAANSHSALFLYHLCEKNKIRVPEDLSIICFDNPNFHQQANDFFTYIEQNSYEIGQNAGEILKSIFTEEPSGEYRQIVLPPRLMVNSSVRRVSE